MLIAAGMYLLTSPRSYSPLSDRLLVRCACLLKCDVL